MSKQPLDLNQLESMFGDDVELRNAILQEFANSADPYLNELKDALDTQCSEGVKNLAHKLKSSSRTVGAEPLAVICEALELEAPNKEWPHLQGLSVQLREALDEVLGCIRAL